MPCTIDPLLHVNLITCASGQSIRVMGRARGCFGNRVSVRVLKNNVPITATIGDAVDLGTDRFVITLPVIAAGVQCGDPVVVEVTCELDPSCKRTEPVTLDCCIVSISSVEGLVPAGSLAPTGIRVRGLLLGCCGDSVVVSSSISGQSLPTPIADPLTGSFSVILSPLTVSGVTCCSRVLVKASCAQDPSCPPDERDFVIRCPECFRAQVSFTSAASCTGTPPTRDVTLHATINIPAGVTTTLQWDYGDGSLGNPFTINNSGGGDCTPYSHSEPPHPYPPGNYTATLFAPGTECNVVQLPVAVTCQPSCPTLAIDPPVVSSNCIGGTRSVTLISHVTQLSGQQSAFQWDFADGSVGSAFVVLGNSPPTGESESHNYAPGTYTARLRTIIPTGCPDITTTVVVPPCPSNCPDVQLRVLTSPIPCSQGGASIPVQFQATTTLPYSGSYTWEIQDATGQSVTKVTPVPPTSTFSYSLTPGTYNVTVTIVTPGCADPVDSAAAQVTILDCCPSFGSGATLSGSQITNCQYQFMIQGQINNPTGAALSFDWDFGDGTTSTTNFASTTHTYSSSGQRTVTVTIKSANCPDRTLSLSLNVSCGPGPTPSRPTPAPGGGPFQLPEWLCAILLALALIALAVALVAAFIAGCILAAGNPVGLLIILVVIIAFALFLLFIGLWAAFCAASHCGILCALITIVTNLIGIALIASIILGLLGNPCSLGAIFDGALLGLALAVLIRIAQGVGCRIPVWPSFNCGP